MKITTIPIFLLVAMNLFGQSTNVKFLQWTCENDRSDWRERLVSIYKEDSLIVLHPKFEQGEFSFKNLVIGEYNILFTKYFWTNH